MALGACVRNILIGLSLPALNALDALLSAYIAELQASVTGLTLLLTKMNIALVPVNLALGVADAALENLRSVTNLLPTSAIEQCAELGGIMEDMREGLDEATRDLEEIKLDANRQLSAVDEVEAKLDELNATIARLDELRVEVAAAIAVGGSGS